MTTPDPTQPLPSQPGPPDTPPDGQPVPVSTTPQQLPMPAAVRVNLLPPSIAQREAVRRARLIAGGFVVGAVVIIGGLWVYSGMEINNSQANLDSAQARNAQLVAEAAQYAAVPESYQLVETTQAELALAMSDDVRWSFILTDLSATIPPNVSLTTMTATTTPEIVPAGLGIDGNPVPPIIGTLTYAGESVSYNDVSAWLESQSEQDIYTDVYFSVATKTSDDATGGQPLVTYSSTSSLTDAALSHRFDPVAGE